MKRATAAAKNPPGPAEKSALLDHIYSVYGEFEQSLDIACRRGCAHCCTRNVTLTTLEAYHILSRLSADQRRNLTRRLTGPLAERRFQPAITTNQLADICLQGQEPPPEESPAEGAACPLLEREECLIYPVRPFHCRCMTSRSACGETGAAEMDPFAVTVNTVFLQYIEHIDAKGCSGNLIDILWFLKDEENRHRYENAGLSPCPPGLIPNRPVPALMIPPKHRNPIAPILQKLNASP